MADVDDLVTQLQNLSMQPQQYGGMPQTGAPAPGSAPTLPAGSLNPQAGQAAQVLARLKVPQAPQMAQPSIFSGAPNVVGQDKMSAFLSGLSGGMADQSRSSLLAQQAQHQNFADNLDLYKTMFGIQNQQQQNAETARMHSIYGTYYAIQGQNAADKKDTPEQRAKDAATYLPATATPEQRAQYTLTGAYNPQAGALKMTPYVEKAIDESDKQLQGLMQAKAAFNRNFQVDPKTGKELPTSPNQQFGGGGWEPAKLEGQRVLQMIPGDPFGQSGATNAASTFQSDMTATAEPVIRQWLGARPAWAGEKTLMSTWPTLSMSPSDRFSVAQKWAAPGGVLDQMIQHERKRNVGLRNGTWYGKDGLDPDLASQPANPNAQPQDQGQSQGASPASAAPQPKPTSPMEVEQSLANARAAIATGAPAELVRNRLRGAGIDPAGL